MSDLLMQQKLLIVGQSGRMLAYAAKRIGLNPIVIDVFADSDTNSCALECLQIPELSTYYLIPALNFLVARHSITHAIYGSGFEQYPDSLRYLADKLVVIGNKYETFSGSALPGALFVSVFVQPIVIAVCHDNRLAVSSRNTTRQQFEHKALLGLEIQPRVSF